MARLAIIFSLILLLGPVSSAPGQTAEVVLGAPTSLTTVEGAESLKAVQLAVEQINAGGGVRIGRTMHKLRVEPFDLNDAASGLAPAQAVKRLKDFLDRKKPHALVIGPFRSEVLLEAMDLLAERRTPTLGVIAMSPAVVAKILRNPKYKYIFRLGISTKYLVGYIIETMKMLKAKFGFSQVFIMNQDVAWARSTASLMLKLYFQRAGWQVLGHINYPDGAVDFSEGLEQVRALGAQVILPFFDMPSSAELVKQWHDQRTPALLCGFISPVSGPGAWQAFGGRIAGVINVIFELGNLPARRYAPALKFYQAYQNRYGRPIEAGHGPAPAYESVYMLAQALERAGSLDPERVAAALEQTERQGAMGRVRFHRGHQVIFGEDPAEDALACVVQWSSTGERVIVFPQSIAEAQVVLPPFVQAAQ